MLDISLGLSLGSGQAAGAPTVPAAPSGLTASIAEASLAFGDTATASVSVSGNPFPTLAYQWTLDGVDVDGQTARTFEGVPVGALRVRVTATNDEGVAGPVTSDPVTVTATAPSAFTAGQWAVEANDGDGELEVTLIALPSANGAAISSVERQVDGGSWVALAGIDLETPYTITGLTNDVEVSVKLRAVNSVGAGAESDTKLATPVYPVPDQLGTGDWTFEAVAGVTDLEIEILTAITDETHIALDVDDVVLTEASIAALATGPVALAVPSFTGTTTLGATMTGVRSDRWLSETGEISYAFSWERDGTPIGGATAETYDLVSADGGTDLTFIVTATDAQGSTASESAATAIPSFAPDLFPAATGSLLNANAYDMGDGGWSDDTGITIAAITPIGQYVDPQTVTMASSASFEKGRHTSLGSLTAATTYHVAGLVKAVTHGRGTVRVETTGGTLRAEVYSTTLNSTLTIAGSSGPIANAAIVDAGDGYIRISYDYTSAGTETCRIRTGPASGVTGRTIDIYGAGVANEA